MAEEAVLGFLHQNDEISDSGQFATQSGISHDEIVNVIKSLSAFHFVDAKDIKRDSLILTDEGRTYATAGSPEVQLVKAIPPEGITPKELENKLGSQIFKLGRQYAIKNKWVEMGKSEVTKKIDTVDDEVQKLLMRIQKGEVMNSTEDAAAIKMLKSRKLIASQIWKGYSVKKGPKYARERRKPATDLTRENLQRDDWKNLEFKEYNFEAKGFPVEGGHLHPLLKARIISVRRQMQMIFLQMGFEEMPTNNYVESSFWNFDALFQPQQHPARDSHDTFFLKEPSTTKTLPEDYVARVKQVHESGGYGSRGYGYDWKREEADKNLLRTHTTAVSSRMLYALAQVWFE
uniref:Phenylalanyl-tRNA synthetase domain-containing protein n=1 Tax=Daucus carota subsp. sativus TaxID=79200 RepID=A0A166DKR1_DAUCS